MERKNIGWQYLALYGAKDKMPQGEKPRKHKEWEKKIKHKYPRIRLFPTDELTRFYEICDTYNPE